MSAYHASAKYSRNSYFIHFIDASFLFRPPPSIAPAPTGNDHLQERAYPRDLSNFTSTSDDTDSAKSPNAELKKWTTMSTTQGQQEKSLNTMRDGGLSEQYLIKLPLMHFVSALVFSVFPSN